MAQFANAFAHFPEENNEGAAAPVGGAGAYRSPLPSPHMEYRGRYNSRSPSPPYRYRGRSPLPQPRLANPPNIFRMVEEARREEARRAINAELRRMRALVPNAYEEDGIIVIPPAAQILAAPAPLRAGAAPQIQATGPPVPEEPDNPRPLNNNNNVNPQPRRNQRRRTRRQVKSRQSRRNGRR